jgi:hypothetical protein
VPDDPDDYSLLWDAREAFKQRGDCEPLREYLRHARERSYTLLPFDVPHNRLLGTTRTVCDHVALSQSDLFALDTLLDPDVKLTAVRTQPGRPSSRKRRISDRDQKIIDEVEKRKREGQQAKTIYPDVGKEFDLAERTVRKICAEVDRQRVRKLGPRSPNVLMWGSKRRGRPKRHDNSSN